MHQMKNVTSFYSDLKKFGERKKEKKSAMEMYG